MANGTKKRGLSVEGIVARRDKQPYIKLFKDSDPIAQLSMAEARNFAKDILNMCARTEADAMINKFFEEKGLPEHAAAEIMIDFRNFRVELDSETVETFYSTPSGDPKPH
jgi:hypothetical protein